MSHEPTMSIRNEPRYSVRKLDATFVTVAVRDGGDDSGPNKIDGVVADVSASGLRLALNSMPPKGASVSVHFRIPEIRIDLVLEGVIRWTQPKDRDSWWVGCSLDSPIPSKSLELMATNAIMDRRQDERHSASCPVRAKWELSPDFAEAEVTNYSHGGCSIATKNPVEPASDRMLLLFEAEDGRTVQIPVRVIWSRGGSRFGCAFLSNRGYLQIREFVESESQTKERMRREELRKHRFRLSETRWRWIAIAALVLLAVQSVHMFGNKIPVIDQIQNGLRTVVNYVIPFGNDSDTDTHAVKDEQTELPDV